MVHRLLLAVLLALSGMVSSEVRAQEGAREQLLHYSLQVDVDEVARAQLATAEAELARGDVLTAVSRWRAILDSKRGGTLVPFRGAFVSTTRVISTLVESLTGAVADEYARLTEPVAKRQLSEAIDRDDSAALWNLIDRFPRTQASQDACVELAGRCFDSGRFAECRLVVDRWFERVADARAAVRREPRMAVWSRLSALALRDIDAADEHWADLTSEIPAELTQAVANHEITRLSSADDERPPSPAAVNDVTQLLPSDEIVWSVPLSTGIDRNWTSLLADFEELAQPLMMIGKPAVSSKGLVVSGQARRLVDAGGQSLWTAGGPAVDPRAPRKDLVDAFRNALGESISGRMLVTGDRVLSVRPLQNARPQTAFADQLDVESLQDGKVLQTLRQFPAPSSSEPKPATVLGPPGAGHGQLYAILQVDQELSVAAFDAESLRVRWRTRLGDAGLNLMVDHRRRWMPAVIDASGDAVLCATGNGAVVSLDPISGRVHWIHRSEREDWRNAGPPPMTAIASAPRFRMWTGWREPVIRRLDDVVIWAGPEADAIKALDRRTGEVRWSHPRGAGLAVVTSKAALLVIAEEEVSRLGIVDGTARWTTPITRPAGLGFVAGGWYVQPLRTGGSVAIQLADGSATRGVDWNAEVLDQPRTPIEDLRSLTWTPAGIVVQTPTTIALHRTVGDVRGTSGGKAGTAPWLAAAGRLRDAQQALSESGAAGLERARLQLIERETAANHFHLIPRPFERLPDTTVRRETRERVAAFLVDRRLETAMELLAGSPLGELSSLWVESNRQPTVRIRVDALAAATIVQRPAADQAGGLVSTSPAGRSRLDALLKQVASARPDDAAGVMSLLSRSDWGASRLVDQLRSAGPVAGDSLELARRRLMLLTLASLGGDVGARAAGLEKSLRPVMPPLTEWPQGEPQLLEPPRDWKGMIGQWSAPFTPLDDSELDGLSIDVLLTGFNRSRRGAGMGIHFSGCGEDRPWEIDLPKTDRSLGQSSDYRQGLGIGPLVVMQTSTGLHGLLPFDAAGERGATKLWDVPWIDMWGNVATHSVSFLPRLSDVAPGRHPLDVDDFGRPLTQVGPVTASYFCYREFGRLVCCDTATGRRRWDRAPFEADGVAIGDEMSVVVISPSGKRLEILDPRDGALITTRPLEFSGRHWRTAIGTTAYLRTGARDEKAIAGKAMEEVSEIAALDLKTGERKWKQAVDPTAVEFMVGRRLAGAVDAKGIQLFDPADGTEKKRVAIEVPGEITDVYAIDDPFAVMIGVFAPPAVEQLRPPLQLLGNRRKPYANGTVYGLDPETLDLRWTLTLERSLFPLDQPRDIPLLVIHDAITIPAPNDMEIREDRIRCFDKRTGRQIGRDLRGPLVTSSGIVIERSQRRGWVDVRTSKAIYRFQYPD